MSFTFQKLADPVEPFGSDKTPHHALCRLRDFAPNLQDLLIVSSTASADVGLLSRSKTPLDSEKASEAITGVFTTTELLDDTRRPTLPMTTDSSGDSIPIGVSLDLSSKDKVYKPIPSDEELEESPTPLPGLWVMTQEGILCSWWIVYTESVKQGTAYSGLAVSGDSASSTAQVSTGGTPSAFSKPTNSPAFGVPAGPTAFGAASQMGQKASPWGTPATKNASPSTGGAVFGSTSFGSGQATSSPTFGKPSAFGQSSQLGIRSSPWATGSQAAPAFGQSGFAGLANKSPGSDSKANPFGQAAASAAPPSSGGFASFANKGGFAAVANNNNSGSSIFGGDKTAISASPFGGDKAAASSSPFGNNNKTAISSSPFGSASNSGTLFGSKPEKPAGSPFGSAPFKLESSFKRDPDAKDDDVASSKPSGTSLFGSGFGSALTDATNKPSISTPGAKDEDMGDTASAQSTTPQNDRTLAPPAVEPQSTTPTTTPAPAKFSFATSPAPATSLFGQASKNQPTSGGLFGQASKTEAPAGGLFGKAASAQTSASLFNSKPQGTQPVNPFASLGNKESSPKIKTEDEDDAPLPPDATSKATYPIGDSSSSSAASNPPGKSSSIFTSIEKPTTASLSSDSQTTPKPQPGKSTAAGTSTFFNLDESNAVWTSDSDDASEGESEEPEGDAPPAAPLPPDPVKTQTLFGKPTSTPSSFIAPKAPSKEPSNIPPVPEDGDDVEREQEVEEDDDEDEEGDDDAEHASEGGSEGSGIDVAKDLSPSASGFTATPGYTPQSSFGGPTGSTPATNARMEGDRARPLFGEFSRGAPIFPRPTETSPRSPSPIRSAVPGRLKMSESMRSVSAPGMASQILGSRGSQSQMGSANTMRDVGAGSEDPFMLQHRRLKARQEAEETKPLVDEEDDEIQKILASEVQPSLSLDEFIAHSNTAPPAKESIPSQVEAVYKDVNAMIDTLGLNSRSIKAFIKGHSQVPKPEARSQADLDNSDGWVLCEVDDLGEILQADLYDSLSEGRVEGLEDNLEVCHDLARDMHRLRAKQEDLKKIITARMDPDQADIAQTMPLSAEQATQQNELRRELAEFSKLLAQAEGALTMLRTRIASASSSSGRGNGSVPTVEAVMRTITKMTSMVEKRSGDIDVLENQMRKARLSSVGREESPVATPRRERSVMFSPETTPSRSFRHSVTSSISQLGRATPPRKKLSGFSKEEKTDLMEKKSRRQAVLTKLKGNVEKRGVNVWNMEDIE